MTERYDLHAVGARAEARDEFLRTVNRLRPEVILELRLEGPDLEDAARRELAQAWAKRWNLDSDWLVMWASLTVASWQIARSLTPDPGDRYGQWDAARAARPESFFDMSIEILSGEDLDHSQESVELADKLAALESRADPEDMCEVCYRSDSDLVPFKGPDPIHESKEAFLARIDEFRTRCLEAWEGSAQALIANGFQRAKARRGTLETHCEWLVRHQLPPGESAKQILGPLLGDESTVYKGVRGVANLIGLQLRPARGRGTLNRDGAAKS